MRCDYPLDSLSPRSVATFWGKVQKTETCWLWDGQINAGGYGRMGIYVKGQSGHGQVAFYAHHLGWLLEKGPIPDGLLVLHKCDVPRCVRPDHLYLGTHAENMKDMKDRGRSPRGSAGAKAKLTEEDVARIRELRGTLSQSEIAREYGVTQAIISKAQLGQTWAHVAGANERWVAPCYAHTKGQGNGRAKLTDADVARIRRLRNELSQSKIAKRFGISKLTVHRLQRGHSRPEAGGPISEYPAVQIGAGAPSEGERT